MGVSFAGYVSWIWYSIHRMSLRQTTEAISYQTTTTAQPRWRTWAHALRNLLAACIVAVALLGSASVDSVTQMRYNINSKVYQWNWSLIAWEVKAITQKLSEQFLYSAGHLSEAEQTALVQTYLGAPAASASWKGGSSAFTVKRARLPAQRAPPPARD